LAQGLFLSFINFQSFIISFKDELANFVPQTIREVNRPPQDLEAPEKAIKAIRGFSQYEAWREEYEKARTADPMRPPADLEEPPKF